MPPRNLSHDLEQAFVKLAADAGSPATSSESLREQIVTLVGQLVSLPMAPSSEPSSNRARILQLIMENQRDTARIQQLITEILESQQAVIGSLQRSLDTTGNTIPPLQPPPGALLVANLVLLFHRLVLDLPIVDFVILNYTLVFLCIFYWAFRFNILSSSLALLIVSLTYLTIVLIRRL